LTNPTAETGRQYDAVSRHANNLILTLCEQTVHTAYRDCRTRPLHDQIPGDTYRYIKPGTSVHFHTADPARISKFDLWTTAAPGVVKPGVVKPGVVKSGVVKPGSPEALQVFEVFRRICPVRHTPQLDGYSLENMDTTFITIHG